MAEIVVSLTLSVICFANSCYPALLGERTPTGTFELKRYAYTEPGYGGDILAFKETKTELWSIHRVLNVPGQNRRERLMSKESADRRYITNGCINVDPKVYDLLLNCCTNQRLVIR